jgi:hypothetical protein
LNSCQPRTADERINSDNQANLPSSLTTEDTSGGLTDRTSRLGIKVHRKLDPGLLELVYQACRCWELHHDDLPFKRQVPLAVVYEECA